jgi:hypothetical protein
MVNQLPTKTVNGGLSPRAKYGKWLEMLVAQARQRRALQGIRRRRRMAGGLGKPADLHVFKSIEAMLWQPIVRSGEKHSPVRDVQQVQASTACNQKGTLPCLTSP